MRSIELPNVIIIPNPTITTFNNSLISRNNCASGSKNVNNTTARSGGTSPSTNGQGLLLRFNYIMELFQKL